MLFTTGTLPQTAGVEFDPLAMIVAAADRDEWISRDPDSTWVIHEPIMTRSQPIAASADNCFSAGRWECRGGRFELTYFCDEFIQILEGSVTIDDGKQARTLRAGDVAYFPQGSRAMWTVHGYVKKFAIFRSKPYGPLRKLASKLKRLVLGFFRR